MADLERTTPGETDGAFETDAVDALEMARFRPTRLETKLYIALVWVHAALWLVLTVLVWRGGNDSVARIACAAGLVMALAAAILWTYRARRAQPKKSSD